MSVHELIMEIYYAGANLEADKRQMIEPILRRKAIEEASVGVVKLVHNGVASDYDIVSRDTP